MVRFGSSLIFFAAFVAFAGPRAAESSEETFLRGNDAYENQQFDLGSDVRTTSASGSASRIARSASSLLRA